MSGARWWIRTTWPKLEPGSGQVPVVEVDDFVVPARFEATVVRDDERIDFTQGELAGEWPTIGLQIEIENGRPLIRELTIRQASTGDGGRGSGGDTLDVKSPPATQPITASLLRDLPLAQLAKYAMLGVAVRPSNPSADEEVVPSELRDPVGFYRIGPDEFENNYGIRIIDLPDIYWTDHMQTLAAHAERAARPAQRNRISDELLERIARVYREAVASGRPPKQAVRTAENVSESTAGRWITRAREQGHLGKTIPGKKGELTDESSPTR